MPPRSTLPALAAAAVAAIALSLPAGAAGRAPLASAPGTVGDVVGFKGEAWAVASAQDGAGGSSYLMRSDGTDAGTRLVIPPGRPEGSGVGVGELVPFGDRLYFFTYAAGAPKQLWESDGTAAGTRPTELVGAGTATRLVAGPTTLLAIAGDTLGRVDRAEGRVVQLATWPGQTIRRAVSTPDGDAFVWVKTSGLTADLWSVTRDGIRTPVLSGVDLEAQPAVAGDHVFVRRADAGGRTAEPWVTDGTASGTRRVAELALDLTLHRPDDFVAVGGVVYAITATSDALFALTPDGATRIAFPEPAPAITAIVAAGETAYVTTAPAVGRREVWQLGGAPAGLRRTSIAIDFEPPPVGTPGGLLHAPNDFTPELRWYPNAGGEPIVIGRPELRRSGRFDRERLFTGVTPVGRLTFFVAAHEGLRLWRTDGTPAGTWPIVARPARTELSIRQVEDRGPAQQAGRLGGFGRFAGTIAFARGDERAQCRGAASLVIRRGGRFVRTVRAPVRWSGYVCTWQATPSPRLFRERGAYTARVAFGDGRRRSSSAASKVVLSAR